MNILVVESGGKFTNLEGLISKPWNCPRASSRSSYIFLSVMGNKLCEYLNIDIGPTNEYQL